MEELHLQLLQHSGNMPKIMDEDFTAQLPDELLFKILTYVSIVDLPSVRCVCRRWSCLGADKVLWARGKLIQRTAKSDFEISRALRVAPVLGSLFMDDPYRAPSPEVFAAAILTPRIETLQISTIEGVDAINALRLLNRHAQHLRELHLRADKRLAALGSLGGPDDPFCVSAGALLRAEDLLPLLQVIASMKLLKNLSLYGDFEYGYPGGVESGWDSLESIDIRQGILRYDAPRSYLASILRATSTRLRRLQLPRCAHLSPAILAAVSACSRLEDLAPSRPNDLAVLSTTLTSSLQELRVQCDLLSPITALPQSLLNVRKIVLRIGDADNAVAVARACSGAEYLDLRGNISQWALKIVSELPNLKKLRICEPSIRLRLGTGDPIKIRLQILLSILRSRPQLSSLDLSYCFQGRQLPQRAAKLIRSAIPKALILPPVKTNANQDDEGSDVEDLDEVEQ